jgi:hypothetical protein
MNVIEFAYIPFAALPTIAKGFGGKNMIIILVILVILAAAYLSSKNRQQVQNPDF